jgi:hypothetical protein
MTIPARPQTVRGPLFDPCFTPVSEAFTMTATREEIQQEALGRAVGNQALTNFPAIFAGFAAKGIPEGDIRPRENVFTYHAWRALGRQVRRGEHGVKVVTFVACEGKDGPSGEDCDGVIAEAPRKRRGHSRPWSATVFHISQTDPVAAP